MLVYVLSQSGKPLMPCQPSRARKLLQCKKAKVVRKSPFTLQLLFSSSGYKQEVVAAMDTGSKTIGSAAVANGKVVYQAEIELRQDVSEKMQQRATYRRTRRGRKTRYRPARFCNRGKAGRLAPSIRSKIDSHQREKVFLESILPVSYWKVELARFDIHKISNPQVSRWTYQQGKQKDFYNLKAYILSRDGYACQQCKSTKTRLHVHHIVFRSEGGTNTPDNLIVLCEGCHHLLHQEKLSQNIHEKLKKKARSKTKHATEMGIVQSQLKKSDWNFQETFGYETKFKREELNLPKTHYYDAVAICLSDQQQVKPLHSVLYKKHVSKGDYKQTSGAHSEKRIPTGKLFGFKKFDLIQTPRGMGFIKGKRSSGYFAISSLDGSSIHTSVNVKKNCSRIQARSTTLLQKGTRLLSGLKPEVSAA